MQTLKNDYEAFKLGEKNGNKSKIKKYLRRR